MIPKSGYIFISALILMVLISCRSAGITCRLSSDLAGSAGGTITMEWDSNTEKNLAGYRIFYGTAPGKYQNCVDVGKPPESSPGTTKYTLTGLTAGERYYLAVIAYSIYDTPTGGSGFSNEVSAVAK